MSEKKQTKTFLTTAFVVVLAILAVMVLRAAFDRQKTTSPVKEESAGQTETAGKNQDDMIDENESAKVLKSEAEPATLTIKSDQSEKSLAKIVASSRNFRATFQGWYGKAAPDFAVTDLDGKEHRLSDYRGKDVLLIFWATWCMPCISEIPDLKKLRNQIGEDKLAMLAISSEKPSKVRKVAEAIRINYTVAVTDNMPIPYSQIQSIPSTFFIRPDGTIKLVTAGMLGLEDIKMILKAD